MSLFSVPIWRSVTIGRLPRLFTKQWIAAGNKRLKEASHITVEYCMWAWLTASAPSLRAASTSTLTLWLIKLSESTPFVIVYTWKLVGLISFSAAFCSHCAWTLLGEPYAIVQLACRQTRPLPKPDQRLYLVYLCIAFRQFNLKPK